MTNEECLLIYTPLFLATCVMFVSMLRKRDKSYLLRQGLCFFCLLLMWQVCEILYFLSREASLLSFLIDLKLVFISFLAVNAFFLIAGFYRANRNFPKWLPYALCVIPAITTVLACSTNAHHLLKETFAIVSDTPLITTQLQRGSWYSVYSIYSQLLVLAGIFILLVKWRSLPKAYRGGSSFLLLSISVYAVGSVLRASGLLLVPCDLNLIFITISGLFVYLATAVNGRAEYLSVEREDIFDYIEEAIFLLDQHGVIINANLQAQSFLRNFEYDKAMLKFDDILAHLAQTGQIRQAHIENAQDDLEQDIYITKSNFPLIYNQQVNMLQDEKGQDMSLLVTLTDVTRNRLMIERLRQTAGVDALTGIYNRYKYEELLRALDTQKNLPLCLVIGDVNGLKHTNDLYGHSVGDLLLVAVADAIAQAAKQAGGHGARIGGDEFSILVPNCTQERAKTIIRDVHQALAARQGEFPFVPSIALGYAIKSELDENIKLLINEADREMYSAKL